MLKDLRESQGKIAELKERVTAAEDQLKRVDLRSPQTGFVHQLSVHTVGGVINNGEVIMQIVPRADELVVEAKVAPSDIDQIATGSTAIVKVMAGNQRTTPEIIGVITRVSADLAHDPQQQNSAQPAPAYYTVRITLPAAEVARLKDIRLVPGMPVEAFGEGLGVGVAVRTRWHVRKGRAASPGEARSSDRAAVAPPRHSLRVVPMQSQRALLWNVDCALEDFSAQ